MPELAASIADEHAEVLRGPRLASLHDRAVDTHWFSGGRFFLDEHREAMAGLMEKRLQLAWQSGVVLA